MKRDSEIEETSLVISPTVKESNASDLGNGDGENEGMIEIGVESRERKKSRYLSYPYVNWGQKGLSAEGMAATTDSGPNLEITLLNPIWIHSRVSGKPFYAILHRIDVGVVIDLEPARTMDPTLSIAGAVQSQKLAVRAILQLQSLPGGDIKLLCDTVVESVRELTGYDRVMVYKFHEDEHGEVLAEVGELGLLLT